MLNAELTYIVTDQREVTLITLAPVARRVYGAITSAILPFAPLTCQGSPMRSVHSRDAKSIISFFEGLREEV
ncbi:hypothetical protein Y032_0405g881 [Ancylostoma ceylanicum]|uniref:Uncharacterized protein n=1 Tax=Ancylostoma ceylanicum TaxID=53326 RepID=A0A016X3S0_9BILA|nr:hypothetical protein Y032_0405g881 [Ancylostoma ceylanicum]